MYLFLKFEKHSEEKDERIQRLETMVKKLGYGVNPKTSSPENDLERSEHFLLR